MQHNSDLTYQQKRLLKRMRGDTLCRQAVKGKVGVEGFYYWLAKGGRCGQQTATALVNCGTVVPQSDGLFPDAARRLSQPELE
jgi:hypothetical protein